MKKLIEKLKAERGVGLVSVSINTHKTYPEYEQDEIALKNILKLVKEELFKNCSKVYATVTLNTLSNIISEIDFTRLGKSLHLFVSTETIKVIPSELPILESSVFIGDHFKIDVLEQEFQETKNYNILHLSKEKAQLYLAKNERIVGEVTDFGFPFLAMERDKHFDKSNQKKQDNYVREFFNKVDKAIVKSFAVNSLKTVVICTSDNYSKLLQVADKPEIYQAHASINYNKTALHDLGYSAYQEL
ncbi:MAG: hypothetical protein ACPGRC_05720 [Salibacteraceae bacterium]